MNSTHNYIAKVLPEDRELFAFSNQGKILYSNIRIEEIKHQQFDFCLGHAVVVSTGTMNADGSISNLKLYNTVINKGKNIGKSNETNTEKQSYVEALTKYNSKIRDGYKPLSFFKEFYSESITRTNLFSLMLLEKKFKVNLQPNCDFKPSLANKFKETHYTQYPEFAVQLKYNGVRCLFNFKNKLLTSREGIFYHVTHIKEDLAILHDKLKDTDFSIDNTYLDGELYVHNVKLEQIVSKAKKYDRISSGDLKYVIYDNFVQDVSEKAPCLVKLSQEERLKRNDILNEIIVSNNLSSLVVAPTLIYRSYEESPLIKLLDEALTNNYEGLIIRPLHFYYATGFRTNSLLKLKTSQSEDYPIVGVNLKSGSPIENFVWVCETHKKEQFEVKPHGTVEQRKAYYNNYQSYIGKKLQLSFIDFTSKGIPFHITEVIVRDYE